MPRRASITPRGPPLAAQGGGEAGSAQAAHESSRHMTAAHDSVEPPSSGAARRSTRHRDEAKARLASDARAGENATPRNGTASRITRLSNAQPRDPAHLNIP
ncbi:hypothetical protein GCM10020218_049900 [Dactylosporangium vinaceum]